MASSNPTTTRKYASSHPEFFPLDDMYYTLDLDFEDWEIEKNKKKQAKSKKDARGTPTPEEDEKKKKSKSSATSRELRSLLSDVKTKKRGATPTFMYEGQEELYEALESVLTKIKDFTEHSYPFLNKVRASDAPDYYEVIKKPMDLGLMTKKLKRGDYSSKSEFQADLNQIYTNCRIYNTDPSSKIYLEHADCLEKKSKELMKSVKNIDFTKERKLREANPTISPTATPTPDDEEAHKHLHNSTDSTTNSNHSTPTSNFKSKQKSPDSKDKEKEKLNASPMSPIKIEMPDLENETIQSKTDLYRCLTRQYRLQKLAHIRDQDKLPFGERAAIVRDAAKMAKFMALNGYPGLTKKEAANLTAQPKAENTTNATHDTSTSTTTATSSATTPPIPDASTPTSATTTSTTTTEKTEQETAEDTITREVGFFPELCFFNNSVPELHPCISSEDDKDDEVKKEDAAESSTTTADGDTAPLSASMVIKKEEQEDEEMAQAPPLDTSKSSTPPVSPSQPRTPSTPTLSPTPAPPPVTSTTITPTPAVPMHCVEYYNALLRKTIAVVLSKSGFITIGSSQVMDVLTDVVNGYMLRLGKLLKTHIDDVGTQIPFEEIFSRVLCEMGIAGINDIRDFVVNAGNPRDTDMTDLEYDPRNSIYNRSVGNVDYDYEEENAEDEEEMSAAQPETTGRQKRNVTKISERDNMYEYYEEEAPADAGGGGATPAYAANANNAKLKQTKKIVPKKPTPNKKRAKNPPPSVPSKKKKQ